MTVACGDPAGPNALFPAGAVRVLPVPAEYLQWWMEVEGCSGLGGDVRRVRFYVMPDVYAWWAQDLGAYVMGGWTARGNRITVGAFLKDDAGLVRHEMLHALLQRGDHPVVYFVKRCGPLLASARDPLFGAGAVVR